jgi:hypothetical protein
MEKEKTQNRAGFTQTTSVSISDDFRKLINKHHLSPTECIRRGIAITLCDLGVQPYDNAYNRERLKKAKQFLKEMQHWKEVKEKLIKTREVLKELNNL